jgi:hypothetical protein
MSTQLKKLDLIDCAGWCVDTSKQLTIFREVGNDVTKANQAIEEHLRLGITCICATCSARLLRVAEALQFHVQMIQAVRLDQLDNACQAALTRGRILKELGYKTVAA